MNDWKEIRVPLGDRSYTVHIAPDGFVRLAATLRERGIGPRVAIVTDTHVAKLHLPSLKKALRAGGFEAATVVIPPGEREKNLRRVSDVVTSLLRQKCDRQTAVIAFGGGVVGDLAGFVAATFQRGVPLVQIPTTLLAQVDSAIGGKVAVNHPMGKNMIGAFYQPVCVWTVPGILHTLPDRELVCGLGEVVKYGIIRDPGLFAFLESSLDSVLACEDDDLLRIIGACCSAKGKIVGRDERESGLRAILNFGHTVGHALEAGGHFRLLKHGEAVLLGMLAETEIAAALGMIPPEQVERIVNVINRVPVNVSLRSLDARTVLRLMHHDKKAVRGTIRFVLPVSVGRVRMVASVDPKIVRHAVERILQHRPPGTSAA